LYIDVSNIPKSNLKVFFCALAGYKEEEEAQ
jgi:hypothetical protein